MKIRLTKYILSILAITFVMTSCSNDIQELRNNTTLPNNNISKPYKVPGDGKYDLLGYAFDATGVFLEQRKMPYPVIDTKKLESQSLISGADQVHSELNILAGSDAKTLLQKYQSKFTVDGGFSLPTGTTGTTVINTPFTASLSADFTGSSTITNKYTFAFADVNVYISHYAIKPYTSIETLQNCLSDGFISDVQNLTPEQIISKYGTHVYTEVFTGGKLRFKYKCYTDSYDKETTATYYAKLGVGSAIQKTDLALSASTSATLSNTTNISTKVQLEWYDYYTIGGTGASPVGSWTPGQPAAINFNTWSSTVLKSSPTSLQTIDVGDNSLIPIYNFVTDPTKKAALKAAVDNYINNNSQLTIIKVKPIYRYYGTYNHLFTNNLSELGSGVIDHTKGWVYEGIAAFMCEQQVPGTVPVYRFYKTIKKNVGLFSTNTYFDHYYTTNYSSGKSNGYADEGIIGYIFTSQQNNTKPFWQYYNSILYDHMYTTSNELYGTSGGNGYQYNCPIGYVIEGTRSN